MSSEQSHRLLRTNPDPIRIVPAAQRAAWTRQTHRCYHEDGRGRRRRYDTTVVRILTGRDLRQLGMDYSVEWRCPKHR